MSPSGSSTQSAGTSAAAKPFCRRASRNSAAGANTDGADGFLLSSKGDIAVLNATVSNGRAPSEREAGAAAAGGFGLRVLDLESSADQVVDKVDLRAGEILHRDRIDQHDGAGALDGKIVGRARALHVELVLKAGAAATFHRHAQHGAGRLGLEDFADPPRRPFADRDVLAHSVCCPIGRTYAS